MYFDAFFHPFPFLLFSLSLSFCFVSVVKRRVFIASPSLSILHTLSLCPSPSLFKKGSLHSRPSIFSLFLPFLASLLPLHILSSSPFLRLPPSLPLRLTYHIKGLLPNQAKRREGREDTTNSRIALKLLNPMFIDHTQMRATHLGGKPTTYKKHTQHEGGEKEGGKEGGKERHD